MTRKQPEDTARQLQQDIHSLLAQAGNLLHESDDFFSDLQLDRGAPNRFLEERLPPDQRRKAREEIAAFQAELDEDLARAGRDFAHAKAPRRRKRPRLCV